MKVAEEFTMTAETASPQVDVRKDRAQARARARARTRPDLGREPCKISPLRILNGKIL